MRIRPTVAEINLDALRNNFRKLKSQFPDSTDWIPMLKADAYGHGVVPVAKTLRQENVRSIGVSLIEEGLELRAGGDTGQILIFGLFDSANNAAGQMIDQRLTPVLSSFEQIEALRPFLKSELGVHIKINTGMNRLGYAPGELALVKSELAKDSRFKIEAVLTHLHNGDDLGDSDSYTLPQFQLFQKLSDQYFPGIRRSHIWSTSALSKRAHLKPPLPDYQKWQNLGVRPGLSLYGATPFSAPELGLEPVMTFRSEVAKVNLVAAGESAGYSAAFKAQRPSRIGVLPLGYADGYHRALSNKGVVLVDGHRAPVVGRVSMDFTLIDLTELPTNIGLGSEVILFGQSKSGAKLDVLEIADLAGTIPWEILTSVSKRVPREVRGV